MADKNSERGGIIGAIGQFATVVAIVLLTKTVAAEAYYVPSGSMLPSLLIGDQLLVTKFPYGYSRYSLPVPLAPASTERLLGKLPQRGDVVVFRLPRDPSQTYVKRVIGLPGDRVQMRDGRLWLNGQMAPLRRAGVGQMETENGVLTAPRYIESLNGREHPIFKLRWEGELDNTQEFVVPPEQWKTFKGDRQGAIVGRELAERMEWNRPWDQIPYGSRNIAVSERYRWKTGCVR